MGSAELDGIRTPLRLGVDSFFFADKRWVSHTTTFFTVTTSARIGSAVCAHGSINPAASFADVQPAKSRLPSSASAPLTLLRPAVRGQTVRYNRKLREGRGFTFAELKEAGINRKEARGVGIVVDHRRRNLSEEGKALNVERLKAYKAKLVVFPRKASKPKKGDSTGDDLEADTTRVTLSLPKPYVHEPPRKITNEEQSFKAYKALRIARANARYEGIRKLRAAKKEEEEANKKK
ncbi:60S ribosomal protein L13 [Butyriboletus roseoflavus]|nr:60S ribosomal protein L13 [Butyriboletus roseoflavus]